MIARHFHAVLGVLKVKNFFLSALKLSQFAIF